MPVSGEELESRAKGIRLLVLDVDGVLTDGGIWVDERGRETKEFFVRDGIAIRLWIRSGRRAAILSGRFSQAVAFRARELGIDPVVQKSPQKQGAFNRILAQTEMSAAATCFVGDDLPDLPLIRQCGLGATVADAVDEVRRAAHWVADHPGGRGAVRQLIEVLLRAQGDWDALVAGYG